MSSRAHKLVLPDRIQVTPSLSAADVVTDIARLNRTIDRHAFLECAGWRFMGRLNGYGPDLYSNLEFDNPCEVFTSKIAFYITLRIIVKELYDIPLPFSFGRTAWYCIAGTDHWNDRP